MKSIQIVGAGFAGMHAALAAARLRDQQGEATAVNRMNATGGSVPYQQIGPLRGSFFEDYIASALALNFRSRISYLGHSQMTSRNWTEGSRRGARAHGTPAR